MVQFPNLCYFSCNNQMQNCFLRSLHSGWGPVEPSFSSLGPVELQQAEARSRTSNAQDKPVAIFNQSHRCNMIDKERKVYERNLKASLRQRNGQPWKSSDLPPAQVLWSGSQRHQRPQRPQRRQPPCHGPKGKRLIRSAKTQHSCLSEEVTVQMQVGFYQIPITLLDIICVM